MQFDQNLEPDTHSIQGSSDEESHQSAPIDFQEGSFGIESKDHDESPIFLDQDQGEITPPQRIRQERFAPRILPVHLATQLQLNFGQFNHDHHDLMVFSHRRLQSDANLAVLQSSLNYRQLFQTLPGEFESHEQLWETYTDPQRRLLGEHYTLHAASKRSQDKLLFVLECSMPGKLGLDAPAIYQAATPQQRPALKESLVRLSRALKNFQVFRRTSYCSPVRMCMRLPSEFGWVTSFKNFMRGMLTKDVKPAFDHKIQTMVQSFGIWRTIKMINRHMKDVNRQMELLNYHADRSEDESVLASRAVMKDAIQVYDSAYRKLLTHYQIERARQRIQGKFRKPVSSLEKLEALVFGQQSCRIYVRRWRRRARRALFGSVVTEALQFIRKMQAKDIWIIQEGMFNALIQLSTLPCHVRVQGRTTPLWRQSPEWMQRNRAILYLSSPMDRNIFIHLSTQMGQNY